MQKLPLQRTRVKVCNLSVGQTASLPAAQQVISSLLDSGLLSGPQKLVGFINCAGVCVASKDFPHAIGVSAQFMNNVRVRDALNTHHVNGNRLGARECPSLFGYDVQRHSGNAVSFEWGFSPKQVCHVQISFAYMVGRIALMGVSGISPAILWCRRAYKAAASLAGVVSANRRPGTSKTDDGAACSQGGLFNRCGFRSRKKTAFHTYLSEITLKYENSTSWLNTLSIGTLKRGLPKKMKFASFQRQFSEVAA
jgi:hypothetical protein